LLYLQTTPAVVLQWEAWCLRWHLDLAKEALAINTQISWLFLHLFSPCFPMFLYLPGCSLQRTDLIDQYNVICSARDIETIQILFGYNLASTFLYMSSTGHLLNLWNTARNIISYNSIIWRTLIKMHLWVMSCFFLINSALMLSTTFREVDELNSLARTIL
jgi:hypothetical protein